MARSQSFTSYRPHEARVVPSGLEGHGETIVPSPGTSRGTRSSRSQTSPLPPASHEARRTPAPGGARVPGPSRRRGSGPNARAWIPV